MILFEKDQFLEIKDYQRKIQEQIENITTEKWEKIRNKSEENTDWNDPNEWWHGKYYKISKNNNGEIIQIDRQGKEELPNKRDIFVISEGRFSLKNKQVAYLAKDLLTAIIETTDEFRNKTDLSLKDIESYLNSLFKPISNEFGYPLCFMVKEVVVLDLSHPDRYFFDLIGKELFKLIKDRNIGISYPISKTISACAYKNGFHGIAYQSSRTLIDASGPTTCLVLFEKGKFSEYSP